jgi:hypothetical protein
MEKLPDLPDDVEMVVPDDPDTWISDDGWICVGMTAPSAPQSNSEPVRFQPPWTNEIELGPGKPYFKPC